MANSNLNYSSFTDSVIPMTFFEQIRVRRSSVQETAKKYKNPNLIEKETNLFNKTRLVEKQTENIQVMSSLVNEEAIEAEQQANKTIDITSFIAVQDDFVRIVKKHDIYNFVYLFVKDSQETVELLVNGQASLNDLNSLIEEGKVILKIYNLRKIMLDGFEGVILSDTQERFYKFTKQLNFAIEGSVRDLACFSMITIGTNFGRVIDEKSQKFGPISGEQIIKNSNVNARTKTFYTPTGAVWAGPVHEFQRPDKTIGHMTGLYHQPDSGQVELIELEVVENKKIIDDFTIDYLLDIHIRDFRDALSPKPKKKVISENLNRSDNFTIEKDFQPSSKILTSISHDKTTNNTFFVNNKNVLQNYSKFSELVDRMPNEISKEIIKNVRMKKIITRRKTKEIKSSEENLIMDLEISKNEDFKSLNYDANVYSILEPKTVQSTLFKQDNVNTQTSGDVQVYSYVDYFSQGIERQKFKYELELEFHDPIREVIMDNFKKFTESLEDYRSKIEMITEFSAFRKDGKLNHTRLEEIKEFIMSKESIDSKVDLQSYLDSKFIKLLACYFNLVNLMVRQENKKIRRLIKEIASSCNSGFTTSQRIAKMLKFFNSVEKTISIGLEIDKEKQENYDFSVKTSTKNLKTTKESKDVISFKISSDEIEIPTTEKNIISYVETVANTAGQQTAQLPAGSLQPKSVMVMPKTVEINSIRTKTVSTGKNLIAPIRIAGT